MFRQYYFQCLMYNPWLTSNSKSRKYFLFIVFNAYKRGFKKKEDLDYFLNFYKFTLSHILAHFLFNLIILCYYIYLSKPPWVFSVQKRIKCSLHELSFKIELIELFQVYSCYHYFNFFLTYSFAFVCLYALWEFKTYLVL